MTTVTLGQHQHMEISSQPWLQQSVRQCFAGYNWEGRSHPVQAAPAANQATSRLTVPLSLQLSVHQFFSQFPWEGTPEIAAPMSPLGVQTPVEEADDLTLNAFADLF